MTTGSNKRPVFGDDKAFVEDYRPLVLSIVRHLRRQFELKVDPEDLHAAAFQGLLEARRRYDASRGVQFNTFAYYRIRGAVLDHVRTMAFHSRRGWQRLRILEIGDRIAEEAHDRRSLHRGDPYGAAQAIGDTLSKMATAFALASTAAETIDPTTPEQTLLTHEACARLSEQIERLPTRERELIRGLYFEGQRLESLAETLQISKSWASRLHAKALEVLRKSLADKG